MAANSRLAKGPVVGLFQKFKFFNMARPELYGGSYMKNLAAEAPELIACAFMVFLCYYFIHHIYHVQAIPSESSSFNDVTVLWMKNKRGKEFVSTVHKTV